MKVRPIKAWAGVVNNFRSRSSTAFTIDTWPGVQYGYDAKPVLRAIFKTRAEARRYYEAVVPVTITVRGPVVDKGGAR